MPSEPQGQTFKCVTDLFPIKQMEAHTARLPIKLCCGTHFFMTVDKDKQRGVRGSP